MIKWNETLIRGKYIYAANVTKKIKSMMSHNDKTTPSYEGLFF